MNGVHTEVVLNRYADRIFVMVTQMEKVGTLVRSLELMASKRSCTHALTLSFSLCTHLTSTVACSCKGAPRIPVMGTRITQ